MKIIVGLFLFLNVIINTLEEVMPTTPDLQQDNMVQPLLISAINEKGEPGAFPQRGSGPDSRV
ncbi:hypothetical protein ACFQ3N_13000 [Virgibacillus byunsanensis]|uniref:Uncharacterized protein n=1 Tax=Virgibacillus byunsanensis TaxID=570945 RepID=A0ABW3LMI0_9BACI